MKALIWNTQRKKTLKCSNVSVKKYQKRPRFGVWSGTDRLQVKNTHNTFMHMCYTHTAHVQYTTCVMSGS